ncbi:membrane-bound lytic murein transglycosylase MltF [Psychromonas sp. psych-6C06]|uniref:membrane-bound lytic murein transglycosylase MltF n=1 Tax=Psychromonas sp. psych-6C06 TaxID=2058089 RepID=UPI000C32705B|nr:membrane-bound lytic murein transglycosylase MltF [Psychromonas sp. psych-6C06]PKF63105.1 membrane-bound lytic murein transglycosylase MltF [Psychromonas sp. psych-6C06]
MPIKLFFSMKLLLISFALLFVAGCNPFVQTSSLEKIQKRGDIIMGTINSSLTYSYDGDNYSGLDYELAVQFAAYLNVKLTIKEYPSLNELFLALDNQEVDFLGAGLTLTPKRAEKYRSSPPYYYVSQKVVYRKGTYRPRRIGDVNKDIAVLKDSSHAETLSALMEEEPNIEVLTFDNEDQETLLRKVAEKEVTFAIVDSSTLAQKQRYYPVLAEAFTISEKQPVAWLIKRNIDDSLYSGMIEFIGNKYNDQTIAGLEEKYFGHVEHFDYVDTRIFLKRIKSKLPKYEMLFKKYANAEVDWQLLAAVSYQESHWNPYAKSPTGVRGMMMLTLDTADYIGIKNRLDAEQSIQGGAKYLSQLIKRLPDSINDDEKVWFALASYNIGYGHLMDARRITTMKKQNPNSWTDVKDNLPLLHQKKWYSKTRYGYARGSEAQHYVNNIRQYLLTLNWFISERDKALRIEQEKQAELDRLAAIEAASHAVVEEANKDKKETQSQALATQPSE